ncbi:MAG: 50S ribosomal protein L13 [Candidatus Liptonbacteria bacterium]|nr:50S ribosomal protein L13 [Candidatus Liptonbacteria bacterium]
MTTMDYIIDAKGKKLGRLATEIAHILQGKQSAGYRPNAVAKVRVLVKNCQDLGLDSARSDKKIYYRHTGYMGHLKEATLAERFARAPEQVVRDTVRHMLPKNFLNQKRLNNLKFVK